MLKKLFFLGIIGIIPKMFGQNVGIGTTSPNVTLSIKNSGTGIQFISDDKIAVETNNLQRITVDHANVGINNTSPAKILDVDAGNNFLRVTNLASTSSASNVLSYPIMQDPATSDVGFLDNSLVYIGGQTMRLVVTETSNIWGSSYNYNELPVRLKYNPQSGTPTVNGFENYFNDISGSAILYNQNLPAGNGTVARTTDQIQLPKGIYRITMRLTSKFAGHDKNNSIDLKLSVNNGEYSFANGANYGDGNEYKTGYFCETVILSANSTVDFIYVKQTGPNNANSVSNLFVNGSDNVMRSIIMIERLR